MRIRAARGWLWSRVPAVCTVVTDELPVMMRSEGSQLPRVVLGSLDLGVTSIGRSSLAEQRIRVVGRCRS